MPDDASSGGGGGAHVVAPCPSEARCPRVGTSRPCHFPLRAVYPKGLSYQHVNMHTGPTVCIAARERSPTGVFLRPVSEVNSQVGGWW